MNLKLEIHIMRSNTNKSTRKIIFIIFIVQLNLTAQSLPFGDCKKTFLPCSKDFKISSLDNYGTEQDNLGNSNCIDSDTKETNSIWIQFQITKSGSFSFDLTPIAQNDDIDFIIYKNNSTCDKLESIRCMGSGKNLGTLYNNYERCMGATGLKPESKDLNEKKGCYGTADNFLADLKVNQGENYIIFINNYESSNGFNFHFTGTCDFEKNYPQFKYSDNFKEGEFSFNFFHTTLAGLGGCQIFWNIIDPEGVQEFTGDQIDHVKFAYPGIKTIIRTIVSLGDCVTRDTTQLDIRSISVNKKSKESVISEVYPNPAKNVIYFECITKGKKNIEINITNVEGKIISPTENYEINEYKLITNNITGYQSGIYFINAYDGKSKKVIGSKKFVIVN